MTLPDLPTPPPQDRAAALATLLRNHQAQVPADYVMTGLTFRYQTLPSDPRTVLCEPTALFTAPHGIHPGTLSYGLIQQTFYSSSHDGFLLQEVLSLPDNQFETLLQREGQSWLAAEEQQRTKRGETRQQGNSARPNVSQVLGAAALLVCTGLLVGLFKLVFPSTPLLLSLLLAITALVAIVAAALHMHTSVYPNASRWSLFQFPAPVEQPRTLRLLTDEYWLAQIEPATTPHAT